MATTLLLDRDAWDLVLDTTGNIAVASEPYSQAQDVASECRLFEGEAWYDTRLGVPYFGQILGHSQPVQVLKAKLASAAERVPGVVSPKAVLGSIINREVRGQIQFSTANGEQVATL